MIGEEIDEAAVRTAVLALGLEYGPQSKVMSVTMNARQVIVTEHDPTGEMLEDLIPTKVTVHPIRF